MLRSTTSASTRPGPVSDVTEPWDARIRGELARVVEEGRWRAPRTFDALGPTGALHGPDATGPGAGPSSPSRRTTTSGSARTASSSPPPTTPSRAWGTGSGASRLVTGSRPVHDELEHALAEWKGTEAAVCFPTGFAANLGVLGTLGGPGVRVLSDELNHASIIDGCRLSRASLAVYRHRDMDHLAALLASASPSPAEGRDAAAPTLVVTDSVFSMDGDAAPLDDLVALCARHGALLVLDEAHAVLGPELAARRRRRPDRPRRHPLQDPRLPRRLRRRVPRRRRPARQPGAALHLLDGADAGRRRGRTRRAAGPPSAEGEALVARLASLVDRLARPASRHPDIRARSSRVVLGSEQAALDASAALLAAGLWVPAIRPPTVPAGTSRLRVTLSSAHSDDDVARLLAALVALPSLGLSTAAPFPATLLIRRR